MKLFKSWITHNSDKNKEIVASGEMAIATYSALGDAYHTLMARINVADAKMGLGKLLEAEQELNEILIEAKKCGCKDLNTIATLRYANVLACLGKTSIALSYYEEGLNLARQIGHNLELLYGKIWRSLALADFHDYSVLKSIKSHKEEAKEIGCDYLVHLAATFEIIESYLLHRPLELTNLNQNLSLIDGFFVPGLRLEVLCASLLMHDLDTIMIQKYLDEIYTLLDVCEGVKGRPTLIKTLYSTKPHLFSQQSKNNKVETWINNYVTPYIYAFDSVEEILFANLPDRPFIRPCDMTKCSGYCCYDGVYLRPDEEVLITNFIQNNKGTFPHEVTSYIIDGNWHDLVSGRKTSVKQYSYNTDFPAHFTQTKCIFSDKNGLCVLQLLCTEKLWHPWKIKPMSCWFFPLCTEDNRIIPPPKLGEEDRMHIDDTYPGYITCLHCGKEVQDGVSWKKLFKQELLYYYFLKEN